MAGTILHNRKYKSVVLHATSNTTWVIAGNNSVSNVAIDDEIITGGSIKQVWCGSSSGNASYWSVSRGSNVVCVLDSTAWMDYAGNGCSITKDEAGTLVVNLHNGADNSGYIMIEIQKNGVDGQRTY